MRKSVTIVILSMLVGLFCMVGCNKDKASQGKDSGKISADKNGSPQERVEALKKEKEKWAEDSGYNECVRQTKEEEKAFQKCVRDKIKAAGYTDNIKCVGNGNYENTICKSETEIKGKTRYNAEVYANNDCIKEFKNSKALSEFECAELLNKK